jgi:type I restriction enzyme S subunit
MVPNGWKEVKLGEVIKHQKGYAFKSDSYITEGVRIIRISDTTRNSIHDKSPVYIDESETASLSQYKLNAEDIILSTVGSRPHLLDSMVGKAVKVPVKDKGALLNQNLVKLVPKDNLITNNYLFSMITKSKFNYFISTLVRGNANQVSITLKELFAYTFPLPSLPEQQKIAKILSTWDKAISATERLIENSTQQKKALMQQLLTGKKRLLDESGKRFEGEWNKVKLGDICLKVTDGAHHSPQSVESGYPMYSVKDMTSSGFRKNSARLISKEDFDQLVNQNCKPELNDILIAKDGSILKYCFVVKEKVEGVILSSIALLRPNLEQVFPEFIAQYFSQDYVKFFVGKALTSGSGVPRIVLKDFKGIQIALPSIDEQQKIATVLINADKEIELLEQQLADLQQEKKALMQQLLTGKKRVVVGCDTDDNEG